MTAFQPLGEVLRIIITGAAGQCPYTPASRTWHTLESTEITAFFGQDDHQGTGIALTFGQDRGEAALGLNLADQGACFEMGGKARRDWARIVKPIRQADGPAGQRGRNRARRSGSDQAASRSITLHKRPYSASAPGASLSA